MEVHDFLNHSGPGSSSSRHRRAHASPQLEAKPVLGQGSASQLESIILHTKRCAPSSVHTPSALSGTSILGPARAASISCGSVPAGSFPSHTLKRKFGSEMTDNRRSPLPSFQQSQPITPLTSAQSRSVSQPLVRPDTYPAHRASPLPPPIALQGAHPGPPMASQTLPPQLPPRSSTMAGAPGKGPHPPAQTMQMSGPSMASTLVGGEEAYMTLPGSDVSIPVQVDCSQASKKADEKRQRNAKASMRHRRKKKTLQEEKMRQLQGLADDMELIKAQRDHYKAERDRLQDIIMAQPSISYQAAGPPTPTSLRDNDSFVDVSPTGQTPQLTTPSQGYASEASSTIERPCQRTGPDNMLVYGRPTGGSSGSLPSTQRQSYKIPPQATSASSAGRMDQLPPFRCIEEGPPVSTKAMGSGTHGQDPRRGQWMPVPARRCDADGVTVTRDPLEGQIVDKGRVSSYYRHPDHPPGPGRFALTS